MDALSVFFLALGGVVMVVALVMIVGFAISMPLGVAYAVKDHHEHQPPHEGHTHRHQSPTLGR